MIEASTRLRRAIMLNDVLLVRRIVRNHPHLLQNPDLEDKSNTSLHLAAANGTVDIVQHLIEAGHEDEAISRNTDNDTPLMLAARKSQVEVGKLLIEKFPGCISMVNNSGKDALAIACQNPASTPLLPLLLYHPQFPASPNARDDDGNTALHHASASGSLKALRILLEAGANPGAHNNHDWTPMAYSQTVAAEVYFKNLVADFERKRAEGAKQGEERERQRAAGLRLVEDDGSESRARLTDEDEMIGDALKRHFSPVERKRPQTPGSATRHEWGAGLQHARTRSSSGG